jgi:PKD repeat protein
VNMKKILIGLIVCMFLASILPNLLGEKNTNELSFKERRFIEQKDLKGIYTKYGLEKMPGAKGKPGAYVTITSPVDGATVSGTVIISLNSNYDPTITIDGTAVLVGFSYSWDTTQYSDGDHVIQAAARGVTDIHTVTVSNGGVTTNNPPDASFTYSTTYLTAYFTDTSIDSDGTIDSWNWNFGDDSTSSLENPSHNYATDGTYTVSLTVTDDDGDTDMISHPVTVSSVGGGEVDKKYALVIGISDYEGTSSDLEYCDDDAQDWKSFLQGEGYIVTTLIDGQATADNIIAEIQNLVADADGDDYITFAYSGHGAELTGYGSCIVSADLYGIDHGYVEYLFDGEDCQHIFFSFDACVIGDFQGLITNNRVGAFASNNRNSYDGDSSMQNGVFTYYQMEGWYSYNFFEDDSAYSVQQMKAWPPSPRIKVDPFYVDQFAGDMEP